MSTVTIITTTYKHEKYIEKTIQSILGQSHTDWEMLIGDDSPDNTTWVVIQKYIAKYPNKIKARHHKPNKGIVENTNFLLSQLSKDTRYIAFLEGDDMYTADNIAKKLDVFSKYKDVVLVYNDLAFIDSNDKVLLKSFFTQRSVPLYINEKIPVEKFLGHEAGPIASWSSCMVKREMIEKYTIVNLEPGNKRYSISDYDFYYRIATQNNVYGINESLTYYRRHPGNLSGSNGGTSNDLSILIDHYYKNKIITSNLYNKKMGWISIVSSIFAIETGDKKNAWKFLQQAWEHNHSAYLKYKIAIICFLLLPTIINKKILQIIMKRG